MSGAHCDTLIDVDGVAMPLLIRRHALARGYRLRVDVGARVLRLTVPARCSMRSAVAWAKGQGMWITGQLALAPGPVPLSHGAIFPLEGRDTSICWHADHPRAPVLVDQSLGLGGDPAAVGRRVLAWLRARARDVLTLESRDMADAHGLSLASVAIGDPRSRWGSCSARGALRYSWRLILAPVEVRRAIVAHEVAHLRHMNHSADFHAAHAELLGDDPRPAQLWLRRHGRDLHRYGA